MGGDIYMVNHTRRQYENLGTAGEFGNYNDDSNNYVRCYWSKGWRYSDDIEKMDYGSFNGYRCVERADDIDGCDCFACVRNPNNEYWTNITKKEGFRLDSNLKANYESVIEHNWNIEEDDIKCGSCEIRCGEYIFLS